MRAIQFYRAKDNSPCGEMNMSAGGQIIAKGLAQSVLDTARMRGDSDQKTFEKYASWANQAVYSKEVRPSKVVKIEYPETTKPLDRSPKKNWVEEAGGLPMYIRRIANHLNSDKGMTISHAIAVAVNVVKKMCAEGDLNYPGVQQVNAGSRAQACAALSEWEAKKAGAHVSKRGKLKVAKGLRVYPTDEEIGKILVAIGDAEPSGYWAGPDGVSKRFFSADQRKKDAKKGIALPDGSFPIKNAKDLENAKRLVGRAKDPEAARKHINARAKALGLQGLAKRDEVEFTVSGEISKADAPRGLVFGWAQIAQRADGTTLVDKQGDFIDDPSELEDAAYDFVLNSRDGGEMHVRKGVSRLVESFMGTEEKYKAMGIPEGTLPIGWWTGWKIDDPAVIAKVQRGEYPQFSVHGRGIRKAVEE